MGTSTRLQRLTYGPSELANHCHLWKNARDGGSLVSHQANIIAKLKYIKCCFPLHKVPISLVTTEPWRENHARDHLVARRVSSSSHRHSSRSFSLSSSRPHPLSSRRRAVIVRTTEDCGDQRRTPSSRSFDPYSIRYARHTTG